MRVVVVGATGNIGSSLVEALRTEPRVTSIVGVARRAPRQPLPGVEFRAADIVRDRLEPIFEHLHYEIHVNGRVVDPLTYVLPGGAIPD